MKKLRDILLKYSIKTTFGILLTFTVLLASAIILLVDINSSFSNFKREKLREIQILSDNLYQLADYLTNTGSLSTLEKIIATFSAYQHTRLINLVDEKGTVILSSKKALEGSTDILNGQEGCCFKKVFEADCFYKLENGYTLKMHFNITSSFKDMVFSTILKHLTMLMIFISMVLIINISFFKLIGEKVEEIVRFLKASEKGSITKPIRLEGRNELSYIGMQINQTYRKLWEMINFDSLTKIPNRFFLEKHFNIHRGHHNRSKFMAVIDLDNFKELNDFFGHNFGDKVLINFAQRLKESSYSLGYVCGRLGGDEFVVFGCEVSIENLHQNIEKVFRYISGEYTIGDTSFQLTATMGISMREQGEEIDFYNLLKEADIALYKAKEKGKNRFYVLSEEEKEVELKRKKLYSELTMAVENREIFMVYQPIVDGQTGDAVAYEALVRWNSKKFGPVSPGDFIPYLEATGQIIKVGKYIMEEVIKSIPVLGKPVHVNVSSKQLFEKDVADYIKNLLTKNRLSSSMLVVEITETQEIPKDSVVVENLTKLKEFGINLALDDFGTGYSNLYTISQLKPKSIKIDIHLIRDLDRDSSKLGVVKAIKEMADALGISVVAEGVENENIRNILLSIGIRYMQGYLFDKPRKLEEIVGT